MTPELTARANGQCELCNAQAELFTFEVSAPEPTSDAYIAICNNCREQANGEAELNPNHWRCLNDTMWSPTPAVQVAAWRLLTQLNEEIWAQDALEMLYLDEELLKWAKHGLNTNTEQAPTKDSNGNTLQAGDNVVIIKDLDVKGTSFVAKRGTAVRGISLTDNPEHIEGRVNGTRIVILTKYVKKS